MIQRRQQDTVADRSTGVGQDNSEVIRPLNDVVEEEVELEPPEEEQFGARKPRKILDPNCHPSKRLTHTVSLTSPTATGAHTVSWVKESLRHTSKEHPGKIAYPKCSSTTALCRQQVNLSPRS